jgi:hypothetical protein
MKSSLRLLLFLLACATACQKELSYERSGTSNKPPIAAAGPDQVISLPTDSAILNGSASNDADGNIAAWQWTQVSGPSPAGIVRSDSARTIVKNLKQGIYQFELKITDNGGALAKDTVQVTVNAAGTTNKPPVACAGADQTIMLPVNTMQLDGACSTDPDNNITGYTWTKISGPSSAVIASPDSAKTIVSNLAQGIYQFELKVTDNGGAIAKDTVQVTVNAAVVTNKPPVACAGADHTITLPVNTVQLDGTCSTDPENNITTYQWVKISGPSSFTIANANAVQIQVTNLALGSYLFELKVTDAGGLLDKDTVEITVLPPLLSGSNVYIAGWGKNARGKAVARIWHNGAAQDLSNGQYDAWAGSVFVSGTDVYVAGFEKNASGRTVAKLWKNGVAQNLSNGQHNAYANSVFVSGAVVYVAGLENNASDRSVAKLWKNGVAQNLSNGQDYASAISVFVAGSDVYVAGHVNDTAVIWKNELANPLLQGNKFEVEVAHAVFVSGNDVYVAGGRYDCCPSWAPFLWKNAVVQDLEGSDAFSLFVSGDDVYVTGSGTIWKNGVAQSLSNGQYYAHSRSVFVSGPDVYVAGWMPSWFSKNAILWKNGIAYSVSGLSESYSVFVQ